MPSDGSYDIEEGLISGFPCTCSGGEWKVVEGLEIDDFSRERIDASVAELKEERDAVKELGLSSRSASRSARGSSRAASS